MNVSVWITSYNQKELLKEAVNSVLAQTLCPHEIIIVDDCSSDGSQAIIEEYKKRFPDIIKPILHPKNTGVTQVRIDALTAATGDYITYLDGDDLFMQNKLESEAHILDQNKDIDIVYSNHDYIDVNGEVIRQWVNDEMPPEGDVFLETFTRSFPDRSLFKMEMVRLEKWRTIGVHDINLSILEDYDMRIRLTNRLKVKYNNAVLSRIRSHGTGLSNVGRDVYFRCLLYILNKNKVLLDDLSPDIKRNAIRLMSNRISNIGFKGAKQLMNSRKWGNAIEMLFRSFFMKIGVF